MSIANPNATLEELIPPPTEPIDDNKVYSVAAACISLGVISSLLVIMRLGTRMWYRSFGADDWAAGVALIFFIGWTGYAGFINLNAGVGKPLWESTMAEWSMFWESVLVSTFIYPSMSGMIRISTVFFYQRLFSHDRVTKMALWGLLVFQIAYIIVFTVTPAFACSPISKIREPTEVLLYCNYNYFIANMTSVYVVSIASDLALAVFPIIIVYKLQLPTKKKLTAALIFLFGASATVASVYKFAIHIREGERPPVAEPEWYNYMLSRIIPVQFGDYGTTFWIPSQVEPSIALIGMSLPAMRQLYFKLRGRDVPMTTKASSSMSGSGSNRKTFMSGSHASTARKGTLVSSTQESSIAGGGYTAGRFYHLDDSEIELRGTSESSKARQSPAAAY